LHNSKLFPWPNQISKAPIPRKSKSIQQTYLWSLLCGLRSRLMCKAEVIGTVDEETGVEELSWCTTVDVTGDGVDNVSMALATNRNVTNTKYSLGDSYPPKALNQTKPTYYNELMHSGDKQLYAKLREVAILMVSACPPAYALWVRRLKTAPAAGDYYSQRHGY